MAPANQTKERSVHELFITGAFRNRSSIVNRACSPKSEDAMGGWKKEGGGKPHERHPSQKVVLDPPSYGTFSTPPQVSVLCFSCTKIHDRADQKLFWRGPKIFGRARSLVRFAPPIRFAPPHITAQLRKNTRILIKMGEIHEPCVLALPLVWFAGATPEE